MGSKPTNTPALTPVSYEALEANNQHTHANLDFCIEERERLRQVIRDIHEYQCGCDQPGRIDLCVAQPVVVFEVLR